MMECLSLFLVVVIYVIVGWALVNSEDGEEW